MLPSLGSQRVGYDLAVEQQPSLRLFALPAYGDGRGLGGFIVSRGHLSQQTFTKSVGIKELILEKHHQNSVALSGALSPKSSLNGKYPFLQQENTDLLI